MEIWRTEGRKIDGKKNEKRLRLPRRIPADRPIRIFLPSIFLPHCPVGARRVKARRSKFVLPLGIKQPLRAFIIRLRHEDVRRATQVPILGRGGINKFLRGADAVFFQHHHEHLRVDHRAGVKKFHPSNLRPMQTDSRQFRAAPGASEPEAQRVTTSNVLPVAAAVVAAPTART